MEGTTSISSLPNDNKNQIILEKTEVKHQTHVNANAVPPQQPQKQTNAMPMSNVTMKTNHNLSQEDITQIVNGIKEAGALNLTGLPSRDIPMTTTNITQDEQIKPNFIPKDEKYDYINNDETLESIMKQRNNKKLQSENLDYAYNEVNVSVFIMVLFFIFNLPLVN